MSKNFYCGFDGPIDSASVTRVAATFNQAVNEGFERIQFCLSSLGGYVADGVYLYNHIRSLPVELTIYNTGSVASIAVVVFAAADTRYCSKHGMFMIHPTEMGSPLNMRAETLQSLFDAALADDQRTDDILRARASIPNDFLAQRRFKEVYITPEKAVEFGLCDGVQEFSLPRGEKVFQI